MYICVYIYLYIYIYIDVFYVTMMFCKKGSAGSAFMQIHSSGSWPMAKTTLAAAFASASAGVVA